MGYSSRHQISMPQRTSSLFTAWLLTQNIQLLALYAVSSELSSLDWALLLGAAAWHNFSVTLKHAI
jgi:hypothetical protein